MNPLYVFAAGFRLITQTVVFAVRQMLGNKVQAFLTTLGIIIGVWAIVTVIAAVGGLKNFVLEEVEKIGGSRKIIMWGQRPDELDNKLSWSDVRLQPAEAEMLRANESTLDQITLQADRDATVRYGGEQKVGVEVIGIEPQWHEIEQRYVIEGRQFTVTDNEEQLPVALVNEAAIDEFRLKNRGIGEYIFLNDHRFLIVGVIETREASPITGGGESEAEIFVPFNMMYRLFNRFWPRIVMLMDSPETSDETEAEITNLMRRHRQLPPEWPDTFDMFLLSREIESFNAIAGGMTAGAGVLVGISLLVGGVGIMNIMLVSVSERTREIGLRKAVGAQPAVILTQFLVEAVILCVMGGLIGLVIGQASTLILDLAPNVPLGETEIPSWAIILSIGFSASVGIVFGMWPAVKASRLDPIEALRHE